MRNEHQCRAWRAVLLLTTTTLLGACASLPEKTAEPPDPAFQAPSPAELARLPDPLPFKEPPSRGGNPEAYVVFGQEYRVKSSSAGHSERGVASWYGPKFHGRKTSSGTVYDMYAMTAAHKSLPIPTFVRVTRVDNGRSIVVRVNDRGPFVDDRIIDLSYAAAVKLGIVEHGTAEVEVVALPPFQYLARHQGPRGPVARPALVAGNAGPVVTPAAAAAEPVTATPAIATRAAVPRERAYLQVGAFRRPDRAERLRERLQLGLVREVRVLQSEDDLHRVRIGPLQGPGEIEAMRLSLAELGIEKAHLVHAVD
ncbi:MAG: septal ring lytic transglycosylase RlpA family protein [Candidatus Competibacterales bacterium]|nr:septal ring lytic transglycosylase RlpA family protein [Candidatus Competibacterales bacterium]